MRNGTCSNAISAYDKFCDHRERRLMSEQLKATDKTILHRLPKRASV